MRTRTAVILGVLVLVLASAVGAALVLPGSPFSLAAPEETPFPLEVRVTNLGPNAANYTLEVGPVGGGAQRIADALEAGASRDAPMGEQRGQTSIHVRVAWSAGGFSGAGDRRALVDGDACAAGQTLRVVLAFRTERGVSFDPTVRECL